ncbi:MAG: thioredoxin-disulfide reductase [Deltaproteobacteria bacterium]|nr:thioredoxin-disulfide reductase [Deltaproteobacteria bacterium]
MEVVQYDIVIAGGGPAGLTAGIYASRALLRTLLLEKMVPGGQAASTHLIENYPGFPKGVSGPELSQAMEEQARRFGLEVARGEVRQLARKGQLWEMDHEERRILAKAVIVATGVEPSKLGIPGEEELRGRGVSYCATCDGPFFRDQEIAVIGGGDSAVGEALYLTRFARRVYLVHRRNALRAEKILQERALQNERIEILWDSVVTRVFGEETVEGVELRDLRTQAVRRLEVAGVFFYIGLKPATEFLKWVLELDELGYVVADKNMATSTPGIFAAGDVRRKTLRQLSTAVGDGATAAYSALRYIESLREE